MYWFVMYLIRPQMLWLAFWLAAMSLNISRRVWLQTCTCIFRLALSDTCTSASDVTCSLFFVCFYFISFKYFFLLNLSTFYTSSQVVKTRKKKLNYEVTCNRYLHSSLPATSLAIHTNRACCQWTIWPWTQRANFHFSSHTAKYLMWHNNGLRW